MDIIVIAIMCVLFFIMAVMNKQHRLVGLVAGIGLIMLALAIQTTDIQIVTGQNVTVYTQTNSSTYVNMYSNLSDLYHNIGYITTVIAIALGSAGIFVLLSTIFSVKL